MLLGVVLKYFLFRMRSPKILNFDLYIVGSQGASQLGGYLLGTPLGYKANKLIVSLNYPVGIIRTLV